MKNIPILIVFLFCITMLHAQNEYFLLKGRVVSEDSLKPISNVHIISELSLYGTITNAEGFFSMKVRNIDTLRVSCVGFELRHYPLIFDSIVDKELVINMIREIVVIDEVDILPYPDYETFKREVVNMSSERLFIPGISEKVDQRIINSKPAREVKAGGNSPISLIYNRFNKREVLKRKMLKNRRRYNKQLRKQGEPDSLLLPESGEFTND